MLAVKKTHTVPGRLLEIGFDVVERYTTRESMHLLGQDWENEWFTVSGLQSDGKGNQRCTIQLVNTGFIWTKKMMTHFKPGISIKTWMLYRLPDGAYETQQDFEGEIQQAKERHGGNGGYLQLLCDNVGANNLLTPRISHSTAHSIAPGVEVTIGTETLRFE